jgi:elongation factor Ts
MAVTAQMVKELRERTGAGMMECKKALVAADGNLDLAIDELRKAGVKKAAKKADRETNEGRILAQVEGNKGAMVELLCETDFVSGSDKFKEYTADFVAKAFNFDAEGDITDALAEAEKEALNEVTLIVSEKSVLNRAIRWESEGKIASYVHGNSKIGVMVDVEGEIDEATLTDLCMHIAAFAPQYITSDEVDKDFVAKEMEIAKAQIGDKPDNIMQNILKGKEAKLYKDVCLTQQPWIKDDKSSFSKIAPKATIKRFVRWQLGVK